MSRVCLAEVCTGKLIWHITYFSWGNCPREPLIEAASLVPVGPTKSNDFSWSSNFARKCICITVPEALPIMSLSWKNQRKRRLKDAVKNVPLLPVLRTTIELSLGIVSNHSNSEITPQFLRGDGGRDYELCGGALWKDLALFFCFCFALVFEDLVSLHHLIFSFRVTWPGVAWQSAEVC